MAMKKMISGILMAATLMTPMAAAAQDRDYRQERSDRQERGDRDWRGNDRQRDIRPQIQRENREDRMRAERDRAQREQFRSDQQRREIAQREQARRDQYRRDQDRRDWNRDWRNDRRYDYRSYRDSNRNIYRMPRYQAPYQSHRYSRFSIGSSLNSGFYNQRYWINNPGYYRLPSAGRNYRWVRYYDDALLVDTRRGRVVDVLHNFFW